MATGGSDLTSDEIVNIKCCICAEENRTREAEKYCIECINYYCSSCVVLHKKIPHMKGHTIMDKGDFTPVGLDRGLPSYPTQRCQQHQMKVVDMYCKDHDEVACTSCIALSHRSCKNIISVPEQIDILNQTINISNAEKEVNETKKTMEKLIATREIQIQEVNETLNREIDSVKAFRQELQDLLDTMEQNTIEELKREFGKIEDSLTRDKNQVESLVSSLANAASQLKKSRGNKAQEFVCAKSSQKLTANGKEVEKKQLIKKDETVSFTHDNNIKVYLKQIKILGKVSGNFLPKDTLYQVKLKREIDVKLENDHQICCIWGSCITENGSLLLADYNNKKLKRMDNSGEKVKDYIDLEFSPYAVCCVSNSKAAVALGNNVQFVTLGVDKMTAANTLTMTHKCIGLDYKNGKLFITDNDTTVYIYDINGQLQQRTSPSGLSPCNQNIVAIEDRLFVTYWNNGLVVLDSQGNYLATHNNTSIKEYRGVCTDGINVFVAGWSSNNIVQFGHDFRMLGELGKFSCVYSLCFDHRNMRLIATLDGSNKIVILELE